MTYDEQGRFEIRVDLVAEFPEDYEGEMDGYAWRREFENRIRGELLAAMAEVLRRQQGWRLVPTSSGRDPLRHAEFSYRYTDPAHRSHS